MARFSPLTLRLVNGEWTDRVPSPAHDALTPGERRAYLSAHPHSYLAVTRGPEDLPPGADWSREELLAEGRKSLDALMEQGAFDQERSARFYLYRLELEGWTQTGIVGGLHMGDYAVGEIRVHEEVHHDRAAHLARHAEVVKTQSSPVVVAHRPSAVITQLISDLTTHIEPILQFGMPDGMVQTLWEVPAEHDQSIIEALADERLYLIDGHHRAAAGQIRYNADGEALLLGAVFAVDQMQNRPFHRLIGGDAKETMQLLLTLPGARLMASEAEPVTAAADVLQFVSANEWIQVPIASEKSGSPLVALDSWQFENVVRPILGNRPVEYRAGVGPVNDLIDEADRSNRVLALLRSADMTALLTVADDGLVMPPKSTYFTPKVRSGVFLRCI